MNNSDTSSSEVHVCVVGLGYVGLTTAACLADLGHRVRGVDIVEPKVEAVNDGRSPFEEPGLDDLVQEAVRDGGLDAVSNLGSVGSADVYLVCVGTPTGSDGTPDLTALKRVSQHLGEHLRELDGEALPPVVAVRSTVLPGTTEEVVEPILERASGGEAGKAFRLAHHPEFLREGSAIQDFYDPVRVLVGANDDEACDTVTDLYSEVEAREYRTSIRASEMVKYVDNAFHALKVSFANEIGQVCREVGVSGRRVMDIVCSDTTLNISPAYLTPGFAFGGSCLPKDLSALVARADDERVSVPVLNSIRESNERRIDELAVRVRETGAERVGIAGLTFKPETDDMRESPYVKLGATLLDEGLSVTLWDPVVRLEKIGGQNARFLLDRVPDARRRMVDDFSDLWGLDLIVLSADLPSETVERALETDTRVIDVRFDADPELGGSRYETYV